MSLQSPSSGPQAGNICTSEHSIRNLSAEDGNAGERHYLEQEPVEGFHKLITPPVSAAYAI